MRATFADKMLRAIVVFSLCIASALAVTCGSSCPSATNWPPYTPSALRSIVRTYLQYLTECATCAKNDLMFVMDQSESILASNQWPAVSVVNVREEHFRYTLCRCAILLSMCLVGLRK